MAARKPPETATEAKPGPRKEAAAEGPSLTVVEMARTLRKKQFIERVVAESGMKKKDVKPVVEAALKVLGEALTRGEELILPPLGKARVNRQKDLGSGEILIVKLRRRGDAAASEGDDPLAASAE